jgi:hypothetical protein
MALGGGGRHTRVAATTAFKAQRHNECSLKRSTKANSLKSCRGEVAHGDACGRGGLSGGRRLVQGGAARDRGPVATSCAGARLPHMASWASTCFELVGRTVPVGQPGYMTFPIIQRFSNAPSLKFKNMIFHTFRIYESF